MKSYICLELPKRTKEEDNEMEFERCNEGDKKGCRLHNKNTSGLKASLAFFTGKNINAKN